jgi:hypothetical protein
MPVKEQITEAVVTALGNVQVSKGFFTTLAEVFRPRRTGEGPGPKAPGVRVIQGPDHPTGEGVDGNPPARERELTVFCDGFLRLSEQSTTPMDQALNLLEADIIKAVMADPQFGGLAINSHIGPIFYDDKEGDGIEGIVVTLLVTYQTSENDATVNRAG